MLTRNQMIASDVFLKVSDHKTKSKKQKEEYKSMAEKFPVLVQTAGLAQALSFVEASEKAMQKQLLTDLCATLKRPNLCNESLNTQNLQDYLHLTRQVMMALLWYKRFAKSVLEL